MFGRLKFRHGVHPPESKELTAGVPIRRVPYPDEVVLPLRQHAGKPARAVVAPGDYVERGDKVGEADGYVSTPVHASAAGTVTHVGLWPHPDGSYAPTFNALSRALTATVTQANGVSAAWDGLDGAVISCFGVNPSDSTSTYIALRLRIAMPPLRTENGTRTPASNL